DKYPGDVTTEGSKARAQLDALLQEHAYLLSMTTGATSSGATAEAGAATSSLQASAQDLSHAIASIFGSHAGTQAAQLWSDEDKSFIAYSSAADDASRSSALNALNHTSTPALAPPRRGRSRAAGRCGPRVCRPSGAAARARTPPARAPPLDRRSGTRPRASGPGRARR